MEIARKFGKLCTVITAAAALVMLLIVIADVLLRVIFDNPIVGATEITRMAMICMMPCYAAAAIENRHIQIGLIVDHWGATGQRIIDTLMLSCTAVVCGLISWQSIISMQYAIAHNEFYTVLRLPKWPMMLVFCISMGFMTIATVYAVVIRYVDKDFYFVPEETKTPGEEAAHES